MSRNIVFKKVEDTKNWREGVLIDPRCLELRIMFDIDREDVDDMRRALNKAAQNRVLGSGQHVKKFTEASSYLDKFIFTTNDGVRYGVVSNSCKTNLSEWSDKTAVIRNARFISDVSYIHMWANPDDPDDISDIPATIPLSVFDNIKHIDFALRLYVGDSGVPAFDIKVSGIKSIGFTTNDIITMNTPDGYIQDDMIKFYESDELIRIIGTEAREIETEEENPEYYKK